jgi:hypothetical protein
MSVSTTARRVIAANWIIDEGDHLRLRVTQDPTDNSRWFPPVGSRGLAEDLVETTVGPLGVVYASTVVRVSSSSYPAPYVLSYVDVDGVRVLAHCPGAEALEPGTPIALQLGPVGQLGDDALWSYTAVTQTCDIEGATS